MIAWLARRALGTLLAAFGLAVLLVDVVAISRATLTPPEASVLVRDRHGSFLGEVGGDSERLGFWRVKEEDHAIRAVQATLAIEDRRFYEHPGVDWRAVLRAIVQNQRSGERVSGASTIAMQVARLQSPGERTYPRKLVEAVTALMLVERYGHAAVLEHYLRLAPYGNNVHGIAYAARRYFDKPVQDLSWAETAFLCGLPQAPGTMNPYRASGKRRAERRGGQILALLDQQGLIAPGELVLAQQHLQDLYIPARPTRPAATLHSVLRIGDEGVQGPLVELSLDLALQERLQSQLRTRLDRWRERGAGNAAIIVLERPHEGGDWPVRASVGSADWFDQRHAGAIDYTRVRRYPGSTLKPFVYAWALHQGVITPNTLLDDLSRTADGIENADAHFLGPLLPRRALANSRNVPAVELMERVGLHEAYGLYRDLDLHDDRLSADHYGLGLAIGGLPITLEELARAYTVLAGDGTLYDTRRYEGQSLAEPVAIVDEAEARLIAAWLSDPLARLPTFPQGGHTDLPFPAAMKTGTSQDYRDALTVAWTQTHLVAVWVGHPDYRPMQGLSGYRAASLLARDTLLHLHAEERFGQSDRAFAGPEGWEKHAICPLSGHMAGSACEERVTESFPPGSGPVRTCAVHQQQIDERGRLVTRVVLPARYDAWAARSGARPHTQQLGSHTPSLEIQHPRPELRVLADPEAPSGAGTLQLEVAVTPSVEQVLWYVDGEPFAVVDYPYVARWPLQSGVHRFEARIPHTDLGSAPVRVFVN